MKSIRYATYLAIVLHFIRLAIRRMFTRTTRIPLNAQWTPDKEHLYSTKVVLYYKLWACPHLLFALECYTILDDEADAIAEYINGRYKEFKGAVCMSHAATDILYMMKDFLDDPTFRKKFLKSPPIIGEDLTIRAIIEDITRFSKETFRYEPSFNNFRICEIE